MRYPVCPHCGWLLQINYYADDYEEDNDFICVVQGSCPNPHCQRKYTWEEVYKLADTRDLQEVNMADRILTYIHDHPSCLQRDIAKALDVSVYNKLFKDELVNLQNSGLASCFVQIDPKTGENFYRWGLTKQGEYAIIKM